MTRALLLLAVVALAAACARETDGPPPADPAHVAEVEAWRARRDARLRSEEGWLTLVGLHWLEKGENRFRADAAGHTLHPVAAGETADFTLRRAGDRVALEASPQAGVTHDGQPATALELRSDADPQPTVLRQGPFVFHVISRRDRLGVRVKDTQSPVRLGFTGIASYPIDGGWRVTARFEPYDPPKQIPVPNILGGTDEETCPGALVFEIGGRGHRLEPVIEEGSDELFIIFGDQTNGQTTYGAGRFLYAPMPELDGTTVVDFNKAYNPPCVFTPYATCPLPPPQNRLAVAVEAGEKMYGKQH